MREEKIPIPGLASIVVCAYNNWPDVEMTISSALNQSYDPIEVIVIDNSSGDATPEKLGARFGSTIRYVRQRNKECAGAYNAGFSISSGEYVQFVDGDDVLAPNKIQKQVEIFRANPGVDIVYGDVRMFQTAAGNSDWFDIEAGPENDMLKALTASPGLWLNTLGILFRRRALERVGPWDETLYVEDADYWLRAAWAGCRFDYCPGSPMGFARVRPGQKLKNRRAMELGLEAVWEKALGYISSEPYRSWVAARLARWKVHMAVNGDFTRRTALDKLGEARAICRSAVPLGTHVAAWLAIAVPGMGAVSRSRWARAVRRAFRWSPRFRLQSGSRS